MTPLSLPGRLHAGDDCALEWTHPDYPAPEWTLHLALFNAGAAYHVTALAAGTAHVLPLTASLTATWTPGRYDWTLYAEAADRRRVLGSGPILLLADPAGTHPQDLRSHARRMVDAIEATLEGRASRAQIDLIQARLGSGDREITLKPELLLPLRDRYRAELAAEDRAAGISGVRPLKVRF